MRDPQLCCIGAGTRHGTQGGVDIMVGDINIRLDREGAPPARLGQMEEAELSRVVKRQDGAVAYGQRKPGHREPARSRPVLAQECFGSAWRVTCAALVLSAAQCSLAQPTGNPRGSTAPAVQGNSAKAGANRAAPVDSGAGPIGPEYGPSEARTRRTEPPGGGTAGGLTQRKLTETDPESKSRTDKGSAAPRPVPPSSR
jgi:hypothetical protein